MPTAAPSAEATPEIRSIAVNEAQLAKAINVSLSWLRRDRRTKRLIPFYRLGGSIRYNLSNVTNALAAVEEGGTKPRARGPRVSS